MTNDKRRTKSVGGIRMIAENGNGGTKKLSQYHFVQRKPYMGWRRIEY
jgi:hypothetical protein